MRPILACLASSIVVGVVVAQEGAGPSGATSNPQAAGYSCDPNACKLPTCLCASTSPPGGIAAKDTPQFITITADDAIQSYTIEVLNFLLAKRKNPNGCPVKSTYFTSLSYTNYSMVTDWYVAGNEIADHTMTHAGTPNSSEILGNLKALNAFSGIPISSLSGFRAPLLQYSADTLQQLHTAGFLYDSSATSASPANATNTDAYWPYTLDSGFANDCITNTGVCRGQVKLPGLWEVPMYAIFEKVNQLTGIHLMDPWLDNADPNASLEWMKNSFLSHYDGNRQPFGLYTHPIHLAVGYPGITDPIALRNMISGFLDWVQQFDNVWFVTNQQLLAWMQKPVPISQLASATALGCHTPKIDPSLKICNGIEANEIGLLNQCPFPDFPWTTCYGCPTSSPTPQNPVPPQNEAIGGKRFRISANCSTAFFDPIKGTCLCNDASCAFTDNTGPINQPSAAGNASSNGTASAQNDGKTGAQQGLFDLLPPRSTLAALCLLAGLTLLI